MLLSLTTTFSFLLAVLLRLSFFSFLLHLCLCHKLAGGASVTAKPHPLQPPPLMALKAGEAADPWPMGKLSRWGRFITSAEGVACISLLFGILAFPGLCESGPPK